MTSRTRMAGPRRSAFSGVPVQAPPGGRSATQWTARLLLLTLLSGACAQEAPVAGPSELAGSGPAGKAQQPRMTAGEGLVFIVADPESPRRTDVWQARLSDGAVRPLIQTPDRNEALPQWSERASTLVFHSRPYQPGGMTIPARVVLWRGGREIELPGARAAGEPFAAWAPRDTRLAYVFQRLQPAAGGGLIRNGIAVVDIASQEQTIVAPTTQRDRYARLAFSPDGSRIAAEYWTGRPSMSRIALLGSEGAPSILTGPESHGRQPAFTRDGQYIFFSSWRPNEPRDVVRMRLDGSERQAVASRADSDERLPVPSPVRDEIAFVSDRAGNLDVFLVNLAGGTPRNLTSSVPVHVKRVRWSPDGEHLALAGYRYDPERPDGGRRGGDPSDNQILVIDRAGRVVFQATGSDPDWMPPWS